MRRHLLSCIVAIALTACASEPTAPRIVTIEKVGRPIIKDASDAQIRRALIASSVEEYLVTENRPCPCPDHTFINGRGQTQRCGVQSAYCRKGGKQPLCFDEDVTAEMLQHYRNWRIGVTPVSRVPPKKDACT